MFCHIYKSTTFTIDAEINDYIIIIIIKFIIIFILHIHIWIYLIIHS